MTQRANRKTEPARAAAQPEAPPLAELERLRRRVAELEAGPAEPQRTDMARVQAALYRVADAAGAVADMQDFYATAHRIVGELMYARNFFIGLYDEATEIISFPYIVDEVDKFRPPPQS